jgi:hypothetical protein
MCATGLIPINMFGDIVAVITPLAIIGPATMSPIQATGIHFTSTLGYPGPVTTSPVPVVFVSVPIGIIGIKNSFHNVTSIVYYSFLYNGFLCFSFKNLNALQSRITMIYYLQMNIRFRLRIKNAFDDV